MRMTEVPFTDLLEHVVDNRGRTCPTAHTGRPLIATNCISNDRLYPSYDTERFVSDETYRTWFRGHPISGDLIFVCKGSPGRVALAPDPVDFCIAQVMVALCANIERVYPRYLLAALRSQQVQSRIQTMHVGTLIPHFKKGDFDKLYIPLPNKELQILTGDLFYEMSEKIEQNRRTSAALERLVRAIFRAWFVDFEPVKAKAAGATSFPSMPQPIFDALPIHLAETNMGPMPEGFEMAPLTCLAEILSGGTPATNVAEYWNGNIGWASAKDISQCGQPFLLETERTITQLGLDRRRNSNCSSICDRRRRAGATTGRMAMFAEPFAMNQTCYALACEAEPFYVNLLCSHAMASMVQGAHGSVFDTITKATIEASRVMIAPAALRHAFESLASPVFKAILANGRESRELAQLRDYLLPRLLAGVVRVRETEQAVAEAV